MSTEDDVFQGGAPPIVDCDVLEAAKENVQPLGTGRRVTALSAILQTPHAQREAKLSATKNRLRINIEPALEDEDGDPLDAYCQLVYWTVENYPQGHSAESGLLELLEEATRVLKDDRDGKWRRDMKYLKLWLLYASYVEKPTIIYKFLIANDIGTEHALLYEEYAAVLERDRRRKEADAAYALGIARKAEPLSHLEARYNDFQKRMMSNMFLPPEPTPATAQPARPVLATTKTTTSRTPSSSSSRIPSASRTRPSASSIPPPNGRLQIFVDPTGAESQEAASGSNTWTDIGTRKTRVKENVPEAKKLVGTTIKQAGKTKRLASAGSSSTSKISIYRDPGPEEMPPPVSIPKKKEEATMPQTPSKGGFAIFTDSTSCEKPSVSGTPKFTPFRDETATTGSPKSDTCQEPVIKVKQAGLKAPLPSSEAEALRKDPLKNYGPEAVIPAGDDG